MKKVLVVVVMIMALLVSSVNVYATDSGLNATYYQNKDVKEGDTASAIINHLGSTSSPTGNFEANKEALFNSLQEMGTILVDTFEFEMNDADWRELAFEAGCVSIADRNAEDTPDWFVVKYTGYVVPTESGEYQFSSYYIDNGLVIYIDNQMVFEYWGADQWIDTGAEDKFMEGTTFTMEAGKAYPIEVYYYDGWGGEWVELDMSKDGKVTTMYSGGLRFYAAEPTADEIAQQLATPEPTTPKPATPTPTKAATAKPTAKPTATKASASASTTADSQNPSTEEFPIVPVIIVGAVVAVAVIAAVVVTIMKKKKNG